MRIAALADVHGNLPALEAVLQELERLQPDLVVLDGDLINAVPFSAEVVDRVRSLGWVVVRGNHEFYYLDFDTPRAVPGCEDPTRWGQLHWLVKSLSAEQGAYLATLADDYTFYLPGAEPLRIAHGVPGRNRTGFYNEQPMEHVARDLQGVAQPTLLSAHTHVQIDRHVLDDGDLLAALASDPHAEPAGALGHPRRWHLINPGSVGLPLNGDPRAQFAVLDSVPAHVEPGGWRATMHRVAYDRRPALAAYESSGMAVCGGVMTQLFYWELVTAEPEIPYFYRWAYARGLEPDTEMEQTFRAYVEATGRDAFVRQRDPLHTPER